MTANHVMTELNLTFRDATKLDVMYLRELLWAHGQNEWNPLTREGITMALSLLEDGQAGAILAIVDHRVIGMAMNIETSHIPAQFSNYFNIDETFFIGDVVVDSNFTGRGVGSALLEQSVQKAIRQESKVVLIERHEENSASAGMMEKAGFEQIDCYFDPLRRRVGSRKTVIMGIKL